MEATCPEFTPHKRVCVNLKPVKFLLLKKATLINRRRVCTSETDIIRQLCSPCFLGGVTATSIGGLGVVQPRRPACTPIHNSTNTASALPPQSRHVSFVSSVQLLFREPFRMWHSDTRPPLDKYRPRACHITVLKSLTQRGEYNKGLLLLGCVTGDGVTGSV